MQTAITCQNGTLNLSRRFPTRQRKQSKTIYAVADVLEQGAPSSGADVPPGLNKWSARITQPKSQGASQAMLYGTGMSEADMNKPQVPIDTTLLQFSIVAYQMCFGDDDLPTICLSSPHPLPTSANLIHHSL